MQKLRWGILGTGKIAGTFAEALAQSETGTLYAVGSRTAENAREFAGLYADVRAYGSYEELLADPQVQAVYISLPNHLHCEWTVRCAEAGKHILCEKPLATNYAQAMTMLEAVRRQDVFFMEAFMYRCHPQTTRLVELIRDGAIGEVRLIQANFSYDMGEKLENIRQQNEAAGGGIMDVGCYGLSMVRLLAGAVQGEEYSRPVELNAVAHIGENSRVDEWSAAVLKFPGDILANVVCGSRLQVDSTLRIWGSKGHIEVPNPWFPGKDGGEGKILLHCAGSESEELPVPCNVPLYALEADTVAQYLENRQAPPPCMTLADSLEQQKVLDWWRRGAGLVFDAELPERLDVPATGRALRRQPEIPLTFGRVEGVDKPISRIVMGTMVMHSQQLPYSFALLDDFYERGGTCLDTAWIYAGGEAEKAVGAWLQARGVRDEMVLIAKGAHTPHCHPEALSRQLYESLDRLQVDSVDIYMMHRDNPEIPVAEFVDCLNEHKNAGRITSFGVSNWSNGRLQEANDYAATKAVTGFTSSSVNFSLAQWNEPMWEGCVSASDALSKQWYLERQMPLFAWSSQASGLFTGRFTPQSREGGMRNPQISEVARVWFNDENFARMNRVQQLAGQKNTGPTQIALASVLSQPLNIFALIGPQSIEETRTSFLALNTPLSAQELRWLDSGE